MALLAIAMLCAVGCTKKEEGKLTVITKPAVEITTNSAKSGGNVTATGNASAGTCGICWSETPTPTTNDFVTTDIVGLGEYISIMNNLKPSTKYYLRAYATLSSGTIVYGEEKNFTTLSEGGNGGGGNGGNEGTVAVTTNDATNITITTATCGGNVSVDGEITVTAKGVCYGTSHNPTIENTHTSDGEGPGSFTSNLTGLSPSTKYYVRAYAQSGSDIAYGEEKNFTTNEQPQLPSVTVTLINVTPTYLELKFEPSSNTSYYCFNIGNALTSTTHQTGVKTQKFTNLQSEYLQPNTEYVFSVVAYDASGVAGEIIHPKFKTNPAPYSNYMRIFDNFYQLNYAKLVNQPLNNYRTKEIQIWSEPGYWVRFFTVVYSYVTDNVWDSGIYTTTTSGSVGVGQYGWGMVKNGNWWGEGVCRFTITKSGNMHTYDLYGNRGEYTAHFTGVPTQ